MLKQLRSMMRQELRDPDLLEVSALVADLEPLVRTDAEERGIFADKSACSGCVRFLTLTPREQEVFHLIVNGLLNKQVVARLGPSEKTVKVHRGRVMQKMEANSLAVLVRMAERLKLRLDLP
jgi:FixJ family two-component response regulator